MRVAFSSVLGAASVLLAGCSDTCAEVTCGYCPLEEGVWLFVSDASTGATAVPGAAVDGFSCCPSPIGGSAVTACHAPFRPDAQEYDVTVTAPGYAPSTVHVVEPMLRSPPPPPSCCPLCPATTELSVPLDPA